jgi:hypothetical protein
LLTKGLTIGAIVNAAIIAIGNAKIKAFKNRSKNPSPKPVWTIVTTAPIITLIPKDMKIINKG